MVATHLEYRISETARIGASLAHRIPRSGKSSCPSIRPPRHGHTGPNRQSAERTMETERIHRPARHPRPDGLGPGWMIQLEDYLALNRRLSEKCKPANRARRPPDPLLRE